VARPKPKEVEEDESFRDAIARLQRLIDSDWNDWEADWLDSQADRAPSYKFTENQRITFNQLIASTTPFENYNGWSIAELVTIAHQYRADLAEEDEEFVLRLRERNPQYLRVRQLNRLAKIARLSEAIGRDDQVESVLRETRSRNEEIRRELPAWVSYDANK
jgi:hypothetical protein